ncbi:hypothetical protein RRG08_012058 [Elysia crispata]|uniref:Uncharacterized protein n=1 Tax=Elysia crispata TaxID=231223 RepID=A0AAE0XTB0_9GAST|nr:hypothetical protein RRG08_012058 [Elysia crispata]
MKAAFPDSMKAQPLGAKTQTDMTRPCARPSFDEKDIGQKRAPTQWYPIECRATTYAPPLKSCYSGNPNLGNSSFCVNCTTKATSSTSDGTKDERLKVGSSVRILANQDVRQPYFSVDQPRFITAVVTYVTMDGRYKLGTTKGIIGRLFAREELQLLEKRKLNQRDVPSRSITVRQASSTSYASRD